MHEVPLLVPFQWYIPSSFHTRDSTKSYPDETSRLDQASIIIAGINFTVQASIIAAMPGPPAEAKLSTGRADYSIGQ